MKTGIPFDQWCMDNNPDLLTEWHPTKNNTLTPEMVMPNSTKKVWWQCDNGHEWQATVANRNNRKSGCPYCSGRLRIQGVNDLATLYPNIVTEWNYEKNGGLNPSELSPSSKMKVWWICKNNHEWIQAIDKRCLFGRECPECRKGQKKLT